MWRREFSWGRVGALAAVIFAPAAAQAQSLEPRAYSPGPVGLNFVIAGWAWTDGGLAFDPSLPVEDPKLGTKGPVLAYARTLDLMGRSAKIDVVLPASEVSGSALFGGQAVRREVEGFSDPTVRLSVLFHGAPAMTPAQFRTYRQDLVIGASVQVSAPLGQYDPDRLVNLGTNRWSVKPEIGVSKAFGRWTMEFDAAVTVFSDNDDFFGGQKRAQEPLYSGRAHLIHSFRNGVWASLDATYFAGGRTTLNDLLQNDLQKNWRLGATLALPATRRTSVKFYASRGVSARTGNNFDLLGMAWQYRWGAGL